MVKRRLEGSQDACGVGKMGSGRASGGACANAGVSMWPSPWLAALGIWAMVWLAVLKTPTGNSLLGIHRRSPE